MKILATYCSSLKNESAEPLPAEDLYNSERIQLVSRKAQARSLPFFILSGKFGLIKSSTLIPYYDHLLIEKELITHIPKVVNQIKNAGIDQIEFYMKPLDSDSNLKTYLNCISEACKITQTKVKVIELNP